jgi:hypothetical protein
MLRRGIGAGEYNLIASFFVDYEIMKRTIECIEQSLLILCRLLMRVQNRIRFYGAIFRHAFEQRKLCSVFMLT